MILRKGQPESERRTRDLKQPRFVKRRSEVRHAEGQTIRAPPRGNREPGEIEQVHEVGVGAEPCVELHGRRSDVFVRVVRGRRGHEQRIDALP